MSEVLSGFAMSITQCFRPLSAAQEEKDDDERALAVGTRAVSDMLSESVSVSKFAASEA